MSAAPLQRRPNCTSTFRTTFESFSAFRRVLHVTSHFKLSIGQVAGSSEQGMQRHCRQYRFAAFGNPAYPSVGELIWDEVGDTCGCVG